MDPIHIHILQVPGSAIDANGHVNNVEFVRWMQDAAIAHSDSVGCTAATREAGAMWVARSHRIEYARPAFAGDVIHVRTWIANFRRAFSRRKYQFVRAADLVELASGETDWILVDVATGRLKSIPPNIVAMFEIPLDPARGTTGDHSSSSSNSSSSS